MTGMLGSFELCPPSASQSLSRKYISVGPIATNWIMPLHACSNTPARYHLQFPSETTGHHPPHVRHRLPTLPMQQHAHACLLQSICLQGGAQPTQTLGWMLPIMLPPQPHSRCPNAYDNRIVCIHSVVFRHNGHSHPLTSLHWPLHPSIDGSMPMPACCCNSVPAQCGAQARWPFAWTPPTSPPCEHCLSPALDHYWRSCTWRRCPGLIR